MELSIDEKTNHGAFIRGRIIRRPRSFDLSILAVRLPKVSPHSKLRNIAPPRCMEDQSCEPLKLKGPKLTLPLETRITSGPVLYCF